MKKFLFLIFFTGFQFISFSQNPYEGIRLETKDDYAPAETQVLKAAKYLFSTKYDKDDLERLYAIEFIMKWMAGTPAFKFELDEKFSKAFASEPDLIGLYMAGLSKTAIENKSRAATQNSFALGAIKLIIEYSNKPSNALKQTGELKKMATAYKKGELEKYLGI
jgi:hypothetical protein